MPPAVRAPASLQVRRLPWPLLILMLSVLIPIGATGYAYYLDQREAAEQAARDQIGAIGDLKAQEIARWLRERRRDAATLFYGRLDAIVQAFMANPKVSALEEEAFKWLSSLARSFSYHSVALLDAQGRSMLSFPTEQMLMDAQGRNFIRQALRTRQVVFSDLYGELKPRLDFIVPLLAEGGREAAPIGVLVLRIDPATTLFPLIRSWPTPSPTAEALMVRRQGNKVIFLNKLRDRAGTALSIRPPTDSPDLPAAMAVDGQRRGEADTRSEEVYGIDYRGVEVLAALRPIPESPWHIVAKVDRREIDEPMRRSAVRTVFMVILLMLVAGLSIWAAWRRQAEAVLREAKDALELVNASLLQEIAERKFYESQLEHQANYDSLTALPNRNLLQDRLQHAIAHAHRLGRVFAVLFLDLDRFKTVNDSLGHTVGDALLMAVATRLKGCVRDDDTVARLGGDEFVIVLEDLAQESMAASVAHKVLQSLMPSFQVDGYEFFVTSSIGISLYPKDGSGAEILLKNADIAMYHAKQRGRNNVQFYDHEMNARSLERLVLENGLRYALERQELELYYQPQTDLESGKVVGVEALLRWRHPQLEMIEPEEFVPLAEETGLIVPIGKWVLMTACAQLKAWQDEGLPVLFVAVNLSPRQFMQAGLIELIAKVLEHTDLDPACLELEITESLIMNDVEGVIATLRTLKTMGVQLAIDDFGTGYASLNYLKRFPLDRLKIDKSFVRDIVSDPDDAAITLAVISMAHSLRLRVVAEGVETAAQLRFLRAEHCDEMQGYFFSRPLPAYQVTNLLRANRSYGQGG